MAKTIKVGMLCFLVSCIEKENNGVPVRVLMQAFRLTVAGYDSPQDGWIVRAERPIKVHALTHDHKQTVKMNSQEFFVKPHQLIPIDADPNSTENEDWLPLVNKQHAAPKETSCKLSHA